VASIINDEAAEDVGGIAQRASDHFVDIRENQFWFQQVIDLTNCTTVIIHIKVRILVTNCVDHR